MNTTLCAIRAGGQGGKWKSDLNICPNFSLTTKATEVQMWACSELHYTPEKQQRICPHLVFLLKCIDLLISSFPQHLN